MSTARSKRQEALMSTTAGGPSQAAWYGSATTTRSLGSTPVRVHPRGVGGLAHRPFASLPTYPPPNTSANTSTVSLVPPAEPRRAIVHAYNVVAGGAEVQFLISLEGTSQTNEYEMSLTFKSGGIEQCLGGKETATILVDPSTLKFHVFIFPKPSLPEGSLYCFRVWMEAGSNNVQHRMFSDDDLWVARDPPFHTVDHIALTRLAPTAPLISDTYWSRTYRGFVGQAPCDFIPSVTLISPLDRVYSVALDYEAGGVRRRIFEHLKVRLHCRLEDIQFIIYTVPLESSIPSSTHRLRVWMRGQNRVHTRLYKSDDFRLGALLDFSRLARGAGHVAFAIPDPHTPSTCYRTSLLPNDTPKPGTNTVSSIVVPEDFPPAYSIAQES